MSNTKTTKSALFSSIMAMLLCVVMLIGTTFAWFTDSASSAVNKIQAGTLNIDLLVKNDIPTEGDSVDMQYVSVKDSQEAIFDYNKWEPGYTEVRNVKVSTDGNLALKYTLSIVPQSVTEDALKLAEVIDVYYANSEVNVENRDLSGLTRIGTLKEVFTAETLINDTLIPGENTEDYATIALKMQESAGNDYQNLSVGEGFDLHVLATQYTYEEDSFDNQYDKDAEYALPVATAADLAAALASGNDVVLTAPIQMPEVIEVKGDVTIYGSEDAKLLVPDNADRVINITDNTEPITLTLSGVDVVGPTTGAYTRGVSVYGTTDVTIVADNSSVSANYYALNIASANENVEAVVRNTTLTGWCAFQTWSAGTKATFENCTLIGNNDKTYNADGWNNFATVVINTDAPNTELTFKNCRLEANQTTGNKQYLISIRTNGVKVVMEGCTFFADGAEIAADALKNYIDVYSPEALDFNMSIDGRTLTADDVFIDA